MEHVRAIGPHGVDLPIAIGVGAEENPLSPLSLIVVEEKHEAEQQPDNNGEKRQPNENPGSGLGLERIAVAGQSEDGRVRNARGAARIHFVGTVGLA